MAGVGHDRRRTEATLGRKGGGRSHYDDLGEHRSTAGRRRPLSRHPRLGALPRPPLGTARFAQTGNPTSSQGLILLWGEPPERRPSAKLGHWRKAKKARTSSTISQYHPHSANKDSWRRGSDFPRDMQI